MPRKSATAAPGTDTPATPRRRAVVVPGAVAEPSTEPQPTTDAAPEFAAPEPAEPTVRAGTVEAAQAKANAIGRAVLAEGYGWVCPHPSSQKAGAK